jgi:hypothetical protein
MTDLASRRHRRAYWPREGGGRPARVLVDGHGLVFLRNVGWSTLPPPSELRFLPGVVGREEGLNWVYGWSLNEVNR